MTIFKVGDMVTPIPGHEHRVVVSQLKTKGRSASGPLLFKIVEVDRVGDDVILYYECGYHSYAYRMQHASLLNKSLEDYL